MKKKFENYEIEYNDSDLEYIDEFISNLESKQKQILDFFGLEKLENKLYIKFFDNLEEYRNFRNLELEKYNMKIKNWETACSINSPTNSCINIVSFKESLKCKSHENDNIKSVVLVGAHEFVHTCHDQYKKYVKTQTWFNEGLATYLSGQYEEMNIPLGLTCSLKDLEEGKASYKNYYSMMYYMFNNYDKEFIIKLADNSEMIQKYTPIIFEEAKKFFVNQNNSYIKKV